MTNTLEGNFNGRLFVINMSSLYTPFIQSKLKPSDEIQTYRLLRATPVTNTLDACKIYFYVP